jgi:hypothetical protein
MKQGDTYYLFAVNTAIDVQGDPVSVADVSFNINMANVPNAVDTLFDGGRQVSVHNGTFTDNFDIYEVHIYSWNEPQSQNAGSTSSSSGSSGGGCFIGSL